MTTATATKTSLKKWIRNASNFITIISSRLNRQILANFFEIELNCCFEFPSSTKREIRHFHVVVVRRRQRNVQKSLMHVQSCCFANLNLLFFAVLVAVAVVVA